MIISICKYKFYEYQKNLELKRVFKYVFTQLLHIWGFGSSPRGVDTNVPKSRHYVHFRTNTLGKGINPLILLSRGLNSTTTVLQGWLWHWITQEGWYTVKQRNQTAEWCINRSYCIVRSFKVTMLCLSMSSSLTKYFISFMSKKIFGLVWFCFVCFDDISKFEGHLKPKPFL